MNLGVGEDPTQLPQSMQIRMDSVLRRVSRRFRLEAQRQFTPGTYTHTFQIQGGAIRLQEVPDAVEDVHIDGVILPTEYAYPTIELTLEQDRLPGPPRNERVVQDWNKPGSLGIAGNRSCTRQVGRPAEPHWRLVDNWLLWRDWQYWRLSGRRCRVTYSWRTPVPCDVADCVATIAGRMLTVDPMGALAQSKEVSSRHFRQQVADWVSDGATGFTDDDLKVARSYRWPAPPLIVMQAHTIDYTPSAAFLSDSSW